MRSLFLKIFFLFWLISIVVIALTITITERPHMHERNEMWRSAMQHAITADAYAAVDIHDLEGCPGLRAYTSELRQSFRVRGFLFDAAGAPLCVSEAPAGAVQMAKLAVQNEGPQFSPPGRENFIGVRQLSRSGTAYVFVAAMPGRPLPPWHMIAFHLLLAIIISGIACFLIARSISAPIGRLRVAAQRIATGDLGARAGGSTGGDEVSQLVRDFDHMAAQLEALLQSQRRLTTDISHELRSPLARLSLALGLARQQSVPDAQASLDRIEREAERLNQMIERLLTISRLEALSESPAREPVSLKTVTEEVVADADFEARSRGCSVRLSASAPCTVLWNRNLLRSAVENVLRNAIAYTAAESEVEVTLACESFASLRIRDHGPGVPEAELPNIFRPFYRLDQSRERQTGGAGLGLSIAERAVKLHGGSITATNAAGGGLEVEIRLPVAASAS